jgi:hypothetical protein
VWCKLVEGSCAKEQAKSLIKRSHLTRVHNLRNASQRPPGDISWRYFAHTLLNSTNNTVIDVVKGMHSSTNITTVSIGRELR